MNRATEPSVGEIWAYRARSIDPLVQVVVVRIGVKTPKRVLIRFLADEFEGHQDWVPPARLKVLWSDIDTFTAREERWEAVLRASPDLDSPEEMAASVVFDVLVDPALARLGYNALVGVIKIHDCAGLATYLGLEPDELRADPVSFEEDGDLIAPWPIARLVAKRAAQRDPDRILHYVERDEFEARRDAIFGRDYRRGGKYGPSHVSAETCAQSDEEDGRPVRSILREWSGLEAVDLRSELVELRNEVLRLSTLVGSAVEALRRAGARREADRIQGKMAGNKANSATGVRIPGQPG